MINKTSKSVIVPHLEKINHLSRRAVLVLQAVSTTGPVVASGLSPEEVLDFLLLHFLSWPLWRLPLFMTVSAFIFNQSLTSYVAERVRNSVALASHRVRSLPGNVSLAAISFAIIIMMSPTCHKLGRWRGSLVLSPRKRFVWTRDNRGQSDTPTYQRFGLSAILRCGSKDIVYNVFLPLREVQGRLKEPGRQPQDWTRELVWEPFL